MMVWFREHGRTRSRRAWFVAGARGVLAAGALSGAALSLASCTRGAASDHRVATEVPAVAVRTVGVRELEAPQGFLTSGSLRGLRQADVAANASGRVTATFVERGSRVRAGQPLAQLDVRTATLSAAEARAQAQSASAQAKQLADECRRFEQLKASGAVTDLAYERVAAGCRTSALTADATAARADFAAQMVGDGTIRAPFSGVVTERYAEIGEYARPDSRVVTLVSTDKLRLEFAVPELRAAHVHAGAHVAFRVAAAPERTYDGKVTFISGGIRAATRDLVVEAVVDNADGTLKPGMFADIELSVGSQRLAGVPKEAVFPREHGHHAFFVVAGRLEERLLSTLPATPDGIPVLRGARVGEQVVVGDLSTLRNGQRVR